MADRRRRREGQIWRCNSSHIWFARAGERWRINEIEHLLYGNIFTVECVESQRATVIGVERRITADTITTRNNRWSYDGIDPSFAAPEPRPWVAMCNSCGGSDIVTQARRPHGYICSGCRGIGVGL